MKAQLPDRDRPGADPADELALMRLADDGCPLFTADRTEERAGPAGGAGLAQPGGGAMPGAAL